MCGIYGMVTDRRNWRVKHKLLSALAVETQVRGRHATGLAWTDGRHAHYAKQGICAEDFVRSEHFERIKRDRPTVVIGHDRHATHGAPTDNTNNHPFKSRGVYFIHNGVVRNYELLKREHTCHSECDSEVILRVIESAPRRLAGIQQVYKDVRGSFSCALMDWKRERLYLWRNYGNPMVVRYHPRLNLFVFASTSSILDKACKKADLTEGWRTAPVPVADDYVLVLTYRRADRRVLRATHEVDHKQVDPYTVTTWTNAQLDAYTRHTDSRDNCGKPDDMYALMKWRAENEVRHSRNVKHGKRGSRRGLRAYNKDDRALERYARQNRYDPNRDRKYKGTYDGEGNLIIS